MSIADPAYHEKRMFGVTDTVWRMYFHPNELETEADVLKKLRLEREEWFLEALREALFARAERIREVCSETPIFSDDYAGDVPVYFGMFIRGRCLPWETTNYGYAKKDTILYLLPLINSQAREYLDEDEEIRDWWDHPTIAGCEKFLKVPDGQ